jgi:hypothetical protein
MYNGAMIKKGVLLVLVTLVFVAFVPSTALAQNRFGIHINSEHDLADAYELVGEDGYVTLVIREDERDAPRWSRAFGQIYDLGLIPIVRIATTMEPNGGWSQPELDQADDWARFLNQLPWQDGRRYVVLFNEPNHAKEWGGEIDSAEYAAISRKYWEQLKRQSHAFFVMQAGLDQAAPDGIGTMDEERFLREMNEADNMIFGLFDGWASHSYPNPGFEGEPDDSGRGSIEGYKWELDLLNQMGYSTENLPVFITETGWSREKLSDDLISKNYTRAFDEVWLPDSQVIAVTPFILSYTHKPFEQFSFKSPEGENYSYFETLKLLADTYNGRVWYGPEVPQLLTYGN